MSEGEVAGFAALTPDHLLHAVEEALQVPLTGLTAPLPSYINRVYELETIRGERLVAKFYRPGRWAREALEDEHQFVHDCLDDEIPVVAPLVLPNGETVADADGILFALFPKRSGREMTLHTPEDWRRLGMLVGRIHLSGSQQDAPHRLQLHPESTTIPEVQQLLDGGFISSGQADRFKEVTSRIIEMAMTAFEDVSFQRIHGDCHRGNILERTGEGLMVIDFDDMMMGPPVQDLWLLLPDHASQCRSELNLILEGYEQFMEFDDYSLRLVEILRAMRLIYFLAWCSTQSQDYRFQTQFPEWGTMQFWQREIGDLERQWQLIENERIF